MSDSCGITNIDDNSSLYEILKNCASFQSYDSLPAVDFNDVYFTSDYNSNDSGSIYLDNFPKMICTNQYSVSGNISNSSYTSTDSLGDNVLEEDGRISLAYENLKTIPRRIAEKFAVRIKILDLSYNNFHNLSFLSFFEDLHTLILDRNPNLDVNTLPYLPNLKILWINNCEIVNVGDWIHRISVQCPTLQYLSIMGNPGIKEGIGYSDLYMSSSMAMATSRPANYREYILQMLPNLQYLDCMPRKSLLKVVKCPAIELKSSTASSSISLRNGSSSHSQHYNRNDKQKASTPFSFKELFSLKRRKSSYPSSSTN